MGSWLAGATLVALLPMFVFATLLLWREGQAARADDVASQQQRANVAAAAIGHEVSTALAALRALSLTRVALDGDLKELHATMVRIVDADPRLAAMTVSDAAGRLLLTTRRPYGTELPGSNAGELQRQVIERNQPAVSDLLLGAVTRQHTLLLAVPVEVPGLGRVAFRSSLSLDALRTRLLEQEWPADWTAAVVDGRMTIISRTRDAERFVGQQATASLREHLERGERVFESVTKDGVAVVTAAAPVPGTGWTVVVGRPLDDLRANVRRSMANVLAAGTLCAVFAVLVALGLSRRIARQLQAVVRSHADAAVGGAAGVSIREVAELDDALAQARAAALAQLRERSEMLDVLAHEVRQPLNNASAALQAATATLRTQAPAAGDPLVRARGVLAEVQTSIDNTLAAATLLVKSRTLNRQDADVDALIGVAIGDVPPQEAGRVHVERQTSTRTAALDFGLMRLALRNLLVNALKYSPPGSPVMVRVSDSDEPLALLIDVVDRGHGIEPAAQARLFEPGPTDGTRPGTRRQGLGLHIVRRVMDLHGGSVLVQHTGPDGTTMRLVIVQAF